MQIDDNSSHESLCPSGKLIKGCLVCSVYCNAVMGFWLVGEVPGDGTRSQRFDNILKEPLDRVIKKMVLIIVKKYTRRILA